MAGLTSNGLVIRTQPEIQELIESLVKAQIPGIDLSEGPEQQIIGAVSEQLAEVWEGLQAIVRMQGPEASGLGLDQIAALTGTVRRPATRSTVTATVTLGAGKTLPAGSVAAVSTDPDAQFRSTEAVTNSGGSADDFDVVFEGVRVGPVAAPAGTLTSIVTAVSGWTAITNAEDAALGRNIADDVELAIARVAELGRGGLRTVAAIRASVADIDEVISVTVYENCTSVTDADGRPGKSFEVVVWDGDPTAAADNEIAQAIENVRPEGITVWGIGADETGAGADESGTALNDAGEEVELAFTRAAKLRVYVTLQVVLRPGTAAGWEAAVKAAISARGDEYVVGETGYVSELTCAVLDACPAVKAVTTITMEAGDPTPDDALVDPTYAQIIRIAAADVTVTEAP